VRLTSSDFGIPDVMYMHVLAKLYENESAFQTYVSPVLLAQSIKFLIFMTPYECADVM
jgi:hypothetical protein